MTLLDKLEIAAEMMTAEGDNLNRIMGLRDAVLDRIEAWRMIRYMPAQEIAKLAEQLPDTSIWDAKQAMMRLTCSVVA